MRRAEYLATREGQLRAWRWRRRRRLYMDVSGEPKSKQAMSKADAIAFQRALAVRLSQLGRSAYRSPVVIEMDFFCEQNDPPELHTLAKNYLDLLQAPVPGSHVRRKKILIKDDRLVRFLVVTYHLRTSTTPKVQIQVDTISNLLEDLQLLRCIKGNDFLEEPDWSWQQNLFAAQDVGEEDEEDDNVTDAGMELRRIENDRQNIESRLGTRVYDALWNMCNRGYQEKFLRIFRIQTKWLAQLLLPLLTSKASSGSKDAVSESVQRLGRDMILLSSLTLDLGHSPLRSGEGKQFKAKVEGALRDFKAHYPRLFPLTSLLGITVFYLPPRHQGIDLDNLARYVVPFVHQVIQPPSTWLATMDIDHVKDQKTKRRLMRERRRLARTPPHSILRYQVVQLPRLDQDPAGGYVRLMLDSVPSGPSLWKRLDKAIDKWKESVSR